MAAQPAATPTADQLLTRLAIETAPEGDLPPIQMRSGDGPQFAVYDQKWRHTPARMYDAPVPVVMQATVSFGREA